MKNKFDDLIKYLTVLFFFFCIKNIFLWLMLLQKLKGKRLENRLTWIKSKKTINWIVELQKSTYIFSQKIKFI